MTIVLLCGGKKNRVLPILGGLFVLVWFLRGWLQSFGFGRYLFSLLGSIHIYKFCIGIVVAILYDKLLKLKEKIKWGVFVKWVVFVFLQIIVIVMFLMKYRHYLAPAASIIMFLSWLMMSHDIMQYSKLFIYKVLRWLGDISYSIYLVHSLVIYILINQCHVSYWWLLLPLTLVATIGISGCVYRFIEKPGMDFAKRIVMKNSK